MNKKYIAEFFGTSWLVLGGCGTAVLAGSQVGWLGVSFAFGLSVLTMAYAIGPISGCHLNPAVSVGLWIAGKFDQKDLPFYIGSQVLGAVFGAGVLYLIASGTSSFSLDAGFAANGFGEHSPGQYSMMSALVAEFFLTFMFLMIILASTSKGAATDFAPIAIGLGLTLIHLISIPITNTSVNPARSTSQAVFVGGWALSQLWLFWVAPILGAACAGLFHKNVLSK